MRLNEKVDGEFKNLKPWSEYPTFVPSITEEEIQKVLTDISESYLRQEIIDEERKRKGSAYGLKLPLL